MPHVDQRSGELVIRVVYDGMGEAGKTTNIQQLTSMIALARRGAAQSPGSTGRRTEFFDWLDFSGGFIDGKRVRCQVVSVPGQAQVLHRRRYLLESADAVVYVADARRDQLHCNRENLASMMHVLQRISSSVPVGLIVQANKQDLADALDAESLRTRLELPAAVSVMPSIATRGEGVMQTFFLATRMATDRVHALLAHGPLTELDVLHDTPEALHREMLRQEPQATSLPAERPATQGVARRSAPPAAATGPRNACAVELRAALAPALEISAGHVWPPVKGRALLANATLGPIELPEFVAPWAAPGAVELTSSQGWVFHTADRWLFETEPPARFELLALVRAQLAWGEFAPEQRAAFLAPDHRRWRLWVLTRRLPSLREALETALRSRDAQTLGKLCAAAGAFDRTLAAEAGKVDRALDCLCVSDGRLAALSLYEAERPPTPALDLVSELRRHALELARHDPTLSPWLQQHHHRFVEVP